MVPHADRGGCGAREHLLGGSVRALTVENDLLAATILPDKGADFYGLTYKPRGVDVLWKTPWALRALGRGVQSARESMAAWLDAYPGGWQTLFPSGGGPCTYKGVELNFHGEASMCAWDHEVRVAERDRVEVFLHTRLSRSPFRIERTVSLQAGHAALAIRDRITNEGGEDIDYMWGHHPAFGAPFLGPACRIDLGARAVHADDQFDGPWNPLAPATDCPWPLATRDGVSTDLSRVPGPDSPRHSLAYLSFEQGWYAITNCDLGFGVGLTWPIAAFPYAWFWQEMHASAGYPWYKGAYVMAIEPCTSIPGQGLVAVMEKTGTHRTLAPGAAVEAEVCAVFYESSTGVARIEADGSVTVRGGGHNE